MTAVTAAIADREHDRYFEAFGEPLRSDFAFEDLQPSTSSTAAVTLRRGSGDDFPPLGPVVREVPDPDGSMQLIAHEDEHGVQWIVQDVGRIWVDPTGTEIRYELVDGARGPDVEHYLVGPVLAVAAQMRGETILHAGAVVDDGRAVAFTAQPGYGKSTLAASLARAGHPLLSDDTLPIREDDGRLMAVPYVPKMKLWDETIAGVAGEQGTKYDRVVQRYEKRRVKVDGDWGRLASQPAPLGVIYFLWPHRDPKHPEIAIEALPPVEAMLQLQGAIYQAEMLNGRRATFALDAAARLAERVPIRTLSYFRSFETLERVQQAMLEDARAL